MLMLLEIVLGVAATIVGLFFSSMLEHTRKNRVAVEPNPMVELAASYRDELAAWDAEFQAVTGKPVPWLAPVPNRYERNVMEQLLAGSSLAQQQAYCQQQSMQNISGLAQQQQMGQGSPFGDALGGLLGQLGNNWRH